MISDDDADDDDDDDDGGDESRLNCRCVWRNRECCTKSRENPALRGDEVHMSHVLEVDPVRVGGSSSYCG